MKRGFHLRSLLLLALTLLLAGCAARPARDSAESYAGGQAGHAPAAEVVKSPELVSSAADAERKIIRTANVQLRVQETEKTVALIKDLVATQEGYVAAANIWREGSLQRATLTLRVPAAQMEALLAQVKKLAVQVEREQTGGQDVTEEFVDIEAGLHNLEAAEKELRELLTTVREKSGKAEDIMAVYRELTNIRGQIDRLEGRKQYLTRLTDMATITLELYERGAEPLSQPGWQPLRTLRNALSALVKAARGIVDGLIWIIGLSPLVIVPVLLIWAGWRLTHRRRPRPS